MAADHAYTDTAGQSVAENTSDKGNSKMVSNNVFQKLTFELIQVQGRIYFPHVAERSKNRADYKIDDSI